MWLREGEGGCVLPVPPATAILTIIAIKLSYSLRRYHTFCQVPLYTSTVYGLISLDREKSART